MKFDADGNLLWQKAYGGYVPVAVRADDSGATVAAAEALAPFEAPLHAAGEQP